MDVYSDTGAGTDPATDYQYLRSDAERQSAAAQTVSQDYDQAFPQPSPPQQTESQNGSHDGNAIDGSRIPFDDPSESPHLAWLPSELLNEILSYLTARDLAHVSTTCRTLAAHASNDMLWASLVNAQLSIPLADPGPFGSFRELFIAHHPYWFIPRHKVWISDTEHTGNLILARYDYRRGVIEAYRVIAERPVPQSEVWDWNPEVVVLTFDPKVRLWLDDPVILLKNNKLNGKPTRYYLHGEIRMPMEIESQHVYNAISLCPREYPSDLEHARPDKQWPPPAIPSSTRVYREVERHWSEWNERPRSIAQVSEAAFRIRRWAHFGVGMYLFTAGTSEALSTYATLDSSLYTPTKQKPYQGIWVGDYLAHGCEFILFLQRDGNNAHNNNDSPSMNRGSLEGIKLTGDPNVPRGEVSFIADDIGDDGLVRIAGADEAPFQGSRIVRSRGHVAGLGFQDDVFISSQLILISTNCIAHYWESMGHVTYFRRVDIDALLNT
ncbi:hypothetical protein ASPZODRAFT_131840 [Penicilliopsis zonata CBS 506.65]|uniref:F-box domain-containing protein n=1 Tax=Penicilliopsis zonata CBS 506.65 TaxID=1073090 RepID=A0A1L9SI75_9EURO|nr:hypothetical protein ASPZODRAFT_131840 [Penicilliopsis zonata CBS 506.65]OJJ46930.1 hypothetical protein ASPZODRAFT_131840 [Penicilliopsis zonata CBS 506.65]